MASAVLAFLGLRWQTKSRPVCSKEKGISGETGLSGVIGLLALSEKDATSQLGAGPRAWARCPRKAVLGRHSGSAGPETHLSPPGPACGPSSSRISQFCGTRILSG